ncbi:MAG: DsbA family protein, partial [Myxococcales bacterium]
MHDPIELYFFHDVLCSWCYVADARLRVLKQEFGDELRITLRPYPLRPNEQIPDKKELQSLIRHVRRAAAEPEGRLLKPDVWRSPDVPLSSMPALKAVEAAALQGEEVRDAFANQLREAAFIHGLNVARPDVIFELAASMRLDMNRFVRAYHSRAALAHIEQSHREAVGRGV